ncbi:hypothetical protein ACFRJ9_15920 [Paenarthrobacter sp. NPDC056912]|uniref:hypothetical protein n=1 Tax=Paenarthrobacter sp. NPDC056912 TaxID=3345965 RepID=UPI003673170E
MTLEEVEALRPRKAVLYLRVSSKKQTQTAIDIDKDGNSIATQRDICEQKAEAVNADIMEEFVEPVYQLRPSRSARCFKPSSSSCKTTATLTT